MKTLIIQVKVGNTAGYVYSADTAPYAKEALETMEDTCIPTVKRYCEKYGYDYKMITEYPTDIDIHFFNKNTKSLDHDYSGGGKNKCATLIRYLNMGLEEYDYIVSLDNDIFIPEHAKELPEIKGHAGVEDRGKVWNLPFHDRFINGGVQMVNKKAGQSLNKFVRDKCGKKILPPKHTDQAYMNEWRSKNPSLSYRLGSEWNYMVGCHPYTEDYSHVNFVHYAGWKGREYYIKNFKKGIIK
jgi:hypothetical protein